jgi:DNA repair protein RecO (recombination protein O)
MENYSLHTYILKATQLSASNWRLMLFSQERGRLMVWFRQTKQSGGLDPFIPLWLTIKSRPSGNAVEKIERLNPTEPLTGEALFAGWYLNELLTLLIPEEEPAAEVFLIYNTTLNELRACPPRDKLEMSLRQFEWNLLHVLGIGISLTHDAQTDKPIDPEKHYQCVPELGLIEAKQGFAGQVYLNLSEGKFSSKETLHGAKQVMRLLLDSALGGHELKTRALFRSLYV